MSDNQGTAFARPVSVHPSDARSTGRTQAAAEWLSAAAAVLALTLLFALVNWHWLQANVVTYGWDRMDHLITSLVYNDMVRSPSAQTPFNLLAYSSYYPPLVHFGIVTLYRLFGVSEDVAPFVNVFYLAGLLAGVWAITRRLAGRWHGAPGDFPGRHVSHVLHHVTLPLPRFRPDRWCGALGSAAALHRALSTPRHGALVWPEPGSGLPDQMDDCRLSHRHRSSTSSGAAASCRRCSASRACYCPVGAPWRSCWR